MTRLKKPRLAAALAVSASLLGLGYYFFAPKKTSQLTHSYQTQPGTAQKSEKLGQLLRAPKKNYKVLLNEEADIPKSCVDYFDALSKLNLLDLSKQNVKLSLQDLPRINAADVENICPLPTLGFDLVQAEYMESCFSGEQNFSEPITDQCAASLFLIRAKVTQLLLKKKPLNEISDMHQLSDLLFAELSGKFNRTEAPDFARIKQVTDRMLELSPNLYAAAKMSAGMDMFQAFNTMKKDPIVSEAAWKNAEQSFARAKQINPNDPGMEDTEILLKTQGFDPNRSLELSQQMTVENSSNPKGWFLMAFAQWRKGDRQSSLENLRKAMALDPNNKNFRETWDNIHKPNAGEQAFQHTFSIGVDANDFNE